jgi:hypothetical protein
MLTTVYLSIQNSKINCDLINITFSQTMLLRYFYCKGKFHVWKTAGVHFPELLEHWNLHGILSLEEDIVSMDSTVVWSMWFHNAIAFQIQDLINLSPGKSSNAPS